MKITGVRTIHFAPFANITFLELTTDSGIVGLGETYYTPRSVTAYIGEVLTPLLLESDPRQIEAFWRRAYENSHIYGNRGLEMRCLSAVDVALWDILGQELGRPIWQLLGGTSNPEGVPVYNTCASAGLRAESTGYIPQSEHRGNRHVSGLRGLAARRRCRRTCPFTARYGNPRDEDLAL